MQVAAISIRDLSFRYPGQKFDTFHRLNLEVKQGTRFGLFGPNGAGKTTLMHCMTGLLKYKRGNISLLGHEMADHQKKVNALFGFVPQDFSFYHELSPVQNLQFFGAWSGMRGPKLASRIDELLSILALTDVANKPVHKFSGGMKRRVNLAIAVLNNPPVLFLDEPTVGVDIQTRQAIIRFLRDLNEAGTTLIYTSHQLSEAQEICERIALIEKGKIIIHDDLNRLLAKHDETGLEGLYLLLTGKNFTEADEELT